MARKFSPKLMDTINLAGQMFLLGTFEDYTLDEMLAVLRAADDAYYNHNGESFITDEEYDTLRLYARGLDPDHSYFLGVGSEVRGGKVKLPYEMGSLDQIYEGEITDWVGNWSLQQHFIIASDKLDGTSALLVYGEDGNLQIAYSRGDGVRGADITRHIRRFKCLPTNVGGSMVVRGEVIFPKNEFLKVRDKVKSRSGKQYKNARNMAAGVMNAKTNDSVVYDHIDFVSYEIIGSENGKHNMLVDLRDIGFLTAHADSFYGHELTDRTLTEHLEKRRSASIYEIDGLVLDADAAHVRESMNPTRETLNPAYAVKYKIADASNQAIAIVEGVEWNVSKSGYLKPKVRIEPIDLVGVTITYATGFNAKFIRDNMIGPGAKIRITRSGDVIPFITDVVEPMPLENLK